MQKEKHRKQNVQTLWTRDFTIITLGSVVSMFGNAMSGFAMSLMVLDISGSTFLYAVYIMMYTIPQMVMPIFSGAFLDRFSRKKMIYTLDFIGSGLYLIMAGILATGWFSFPFFAVYCLILGIIESTYLVAYESFYPLLITKGNFQKAYSIASVLETVSAVMVPVSAFLYRRVGLAPLLAINSLCFFAAAVMEMRIGAQEEYIEKQKATRIKGARPVHQVLADVKEGFQYLASEKGLLAVALFFGFTTFCDGVSVVVTLPFFMANFGNGEYWFMLVRGMVLAGRAAGGLLHYQIKIPAGYRYGIALAVYILICLVEGLYLFLAVPLMMLFCFINGFGGVTSYTIRVSATQSYVPDEKKGRFNGAFSMISTGGALAGEMAAGVLSMYFPGRIILLTAMMICAAAAVVLIGGARRHVAPIYNRQQ